jgi:hypothetical protein
MWGDCPAADIKDAWRSGLYGYSAEEMKMGLMHTLKQHISWPPTLGEFKHLCRVPVHASHQPLLPQPYGDAIPEAVKARIDALVEQMRYRPHLTVPKLETNASTFQEVNGLVQKVPMP